MLVSWSGRGDPLARAMKREREGMVLLLRRRRRRGGGG
jgi:hypothetical protein